MLGKTIFLKKSLLVLPGMSREAYRPDSPSTPFLTSSEQDLLRVCIVPSTVPGIGDTPQHRIDFSYCPHGACVPVGETGSNHVFPLPASLMRSGLDTLEATVGRNLGPRTPRWRKDICQLEPRFWA